MTGGPTDRQEFRSGREGEGAAAVAGSESSPRDLGSRIACRFANLGVDLDVTEFRGHTARSARFPG
jgi:hypothetical protein